MNHGIGFQPDIGFTSPSLPVLPRSVSVMPSHRWTAGNGLTTDLSNTLVVRSWEDDIGGVTMSTPSGHSSPSDSVTSGFRSVRFNGTSAILSADLPLSRPHSVAVRFWFGALPTDGQIFGTVIGGRDSWLAVHHSGYLNGNSGGSNGNFGSISPGWHTVVATFGPTDTTVRLDGSEFTRNIGQNNRTSVSLGGVISGGYRLNAAYTDILIWDTALTGLQRTSIENDLRAEVV